MTASDQDIYVRVTNAIVAELEKGARPWHRPWSNAAGEGGFVRPLRANGEPYKGINVLMLWESAARQGFASSRWFTFNQAKQLGANVRKSEKGSLVVYADRIDKTETTDTGEEAERSIYFMKGYTVFNAEQVEGLPAKFLEAPAIPLDAEQRISRADSFVANTAATIQHGGDRAFYAPTPDLIQLPPFQAFETAQGYYATLAHELTHWTKHPARLNRDLGGRRFGDDGYAREELIAEIGAAFLCCDLGINDEPRADHASYLASWLRVLKADKRAIFQAAAQAQKAADYLHGLQPQNMAAAA